MVKLYTTWKFHVTVIAKENTRAGLLKRIIHDGPLTCKDAKWEEWRDDNFILVIENKYEPTTRHIAVHVKEFGDGTIEDCVVQ